MTKEDVSKIADLNTTTKNRTIITLNNTEKLIGYFINNDLDYNLRNKNIWNFNLIKTKEYDEKLMTINGDDIHSIEITII